VRGRERLGVSEQTRPTTGRCTARDVLGHDYDHYDPAFALDPHATYAELRQKCPVAYTENYGGYYVLSRYEDISEVLHDAAAFSSWPADTPPTPGHTKPLIPLEVDPPEHRRYRMLVDPIFRPKQMELIRESVRDYAAELVDVMVAKREFDFITEFAQPFPSSVFLRLIGLDVTPQMRDQLIDWSSTILHTTTDGVSHGDTEAQQRARLAAGKELNLFLRGILDDRIAQRGDDLVSMLVDADLAGERKLDYGEIVNYMYVIVLAGLDTVTTALGFSFLHLAHRADLQDRIAADPSLIPGAINEMLRYESIVHMTRTVVEPRTLSGTELQPGDRVCTALAAAHRDPDVYADPDTIVVDRALDKAMFFGAGNHRCLGQHLARMEMAVAWEEIFKRIPRFSVPDGAVLHGFGGQTRSLSTLPFRTWRDA
jgi:cytochrome P450